MLTIGFEVLSFLKARVFFFFQEYKCVETINFGEKGMTVLHLTLFFLLKENYNNFPRLPVNTVAEASTVFLNTVINVP